MTSSIISNPENADSSNERKIQVEKPNRGGLDPQDNQVLQENCLECLDGLDALATFYDEKTGWGDLDGERSILLTHYQNVTLVLRDILRGGYDD